MEIVERPCMRGVFFLNQIEFQKFKSDCYDEAELKGEKKPTEKDIKTWFSVLKGFCKSHIKTKGCTTRIYSYSQNTPSGLGGRLFCGNSLQGLWGKYRGLLMRDRGTDIDMKNCHPVILRYICKKHNISCPNLEYYINHRDECLAEFEEGDGKKKYLVATNSDKYNRLPKTQHFRNYDKEMKMIQKKLVDLEEYKNLRDTIPDYKNSKNYNGSAINRILCYYENIILQNAIHVINKRGFEIAILMFDGLMIYGNHYDDMSLLDEITEYVEEQIEGLGMKWAYKENDTTINIPDNFDENILNVEHPYEKVKIEFEKKCCKIEELSVFLVETIDGGYTFKKKPEMITSYENMKYEDLDEDNGVILEKTFITDWFLDKNILTYKNVGTFPNSKECPEHTYNLWRPFEMDKYEDKPFIYNQDTVNFFLNHIKVLCNNDDVVYDYIVKWIAQMIQYPEVKSVIPTFVSKEGAGKGLFFTLMGVMMGENKVFETSKPSRDVFGDFNHIMADSFLVIFDEVSIKEFEKCEGAYKNLITSNKITINPKGVNAYKTKSFHRVANTTNSYTPVRTSEDDRRNIIIKSSNELIGNKEHKDKFLNHLKDIDGLRSLWKYLKDIPDMDKFNDIPHPVTTFHKNLKDIYKSPIELWLEDFTRNNINTTEPIELLGVEIFTSFERWRRENNIKFETTTVKMGRYLADIDIKNGITKGRHTRQGDTKYFNIPALKTHFNIGCLIDLVPEIQRGL